MKQSEGREIGLSELEHSTLTQSRTIPIHFSEERETDLVDLGVTVWRRRCSFLVIVGVLIALVVLFAVFRKPRYNYTIALQLGSLVTQSGTLVPLMSPVSAATTLQNTYIPNAIHLYEAKHHSGTSNLKTTATAVAGSTVVTLTCEGTENLEAACTKVERLATEAFVEANSRSIAAVRSDLQASLATAKLDLQSLENPAVFGVQKLAAQKAIAGARNTLTDLQSSAAVLEVRKEKLNASIELDQREAAQLQGHIADVRKAAIVAAKDTSSPTEAMANLLLGTEEQRSVNMLNDIEHKLTVSLPEQLAIVDKKLSDNKRTQALQKQVISQSELALQKLLFHHNQKIQNQHIRVTKFKSELADVQDNRVLGEPLRSIEPVGMGRGFVVAVGIALSLVVALIVVLCMDYLEHVRERLAIAPLRVE